MEYDDELRALATLTMAPPAPRLSEHLRQPNDRTRARPRVAPRVADPTTLHGAPPSIGSDR